MKITAQILQSSFVSLCVLRTMGKAVKSSLSLMKGEFKRYLGYRSINLKIRKCKSERLTNFV